MTDMVTPTFKQYEMKIQLLRDTSKMPTRAHDTDAGMDLYADISDRLFIPPHETVKIGTGIAIELPDGTFGGVFARSGLASKYGLRPSNCVGVVDPDYRGEVLVALHNDTDHVQIIEPNERIAQLIVIPFITPILQQVNDLSETERGESGFGDSGQF